LYTSSQAIDVRSLVLYTRLPEAWEIYNNVVAASPLDPNGYFTLELMGAYLTEHGEVDLTHKEFWDCMNYFLFRQNRDLQLKRKQKKRNK